MIFILLTCFVMTTCATKLKVINDLPIIQEYEKNNVNERNHDTLLPSIHVANFTGPEHLKELSKSCFTHMDNEYKYVLCPFSNMTQEDTNTFYDNYKGYLGIWGEWEIEDNQFTGLRLFEGSSCEGNRRRSTLVSLKCGSVNMLKDVKEPKHCKYTAVFDTPLVCGKNSLAVYPRLSLALQKRWDHFYHDYQDGLYTTKGYRNQLNMIFTEAGFLLPPEVKKQLIIKTQINKVINETCNEQLETLKKRVSYLELQVQLKNDYIKMINDEQ